MGASISFWAAAEFGGADIAVCSFDDLVAGISECFLSPGRATGQVTFDLLPSTVVVRSREHEHRTWALHNAWQRYFCCSGQNWQELLDSPTRCDWLWQGIRACWRFPATRNRHPEHRQQCHDLRWREGPRQGEDRR